MGGHQGRQQRERQWQATTASHLPWMPFIGVAISWLWLEGTYVHKSLIQLSIELLRSEEHSRVGRKQEKASGWPLWGKKGTGHCSDSGRWSWTSCGYSHQIILWSFCTLLETICLSTRIVKSLKGFPCAFVLLQVWLTLFSPVITW